MPVIVPHGNDTVISRNELLKWVNKTLSFDYKKIEDLNTGVAYCQLMESLMPGSVVTKKVKSNAKSEHEYINNFRLLQSAFAKHKIEKNIPIEKLIKGKFQDNFEFLQWFKKFYDLNLTEDLHTNGVNYDNRQLSENRKKDLKKLKDIVSKTSTEMINSNEMTVSSTGILKPGLISPSVSVSPLNSNARSENIDELLKEISRVTTERDQYYNTIKQIEVLLQSGDDTNKIKQINDIIFGAVSYYDSTNNNKKRRVSFNI